MTANDAPTDATSLPVAGSARGTRPAAVPGQTAPTDHAADADPAAAGPDQAPDQAAVTGQAAVAGQAAAAGHAAVAGGAAVGGDGSGPARTLIPARVLARIDLSLRIVGGVLATLAALLSGLLELFFVPLRAGGLLLGLAALAAVPINVAIAWFAVRTVGRRWAIGPPWALWTLLMFFALGVRTSEGDHLIFGDNWAALVLMTLGSVAFAGYAYRLIVRGPSAR